LRRFELWEVSPRSKMGDLKFFIEEKLYIIYYFNRDPYIPIETNMGYFVNAESYPSYLVKRDDYWFYGTYGEIKIKLAKD